jgi:hypothetical protein
MAQDGAGRATEILTVTHETKALERGDSAASWSRLRRLCATVALLPPGAPHEHE